MKLLRSHTSYDYYIKTVYSEFELDALLARKSEKTVVVSLFTENAMSLSSKK